MVILIITKIGITVIKKAKHNMEKVKLGKYKHYKGFICQVIGVAKHSENPTQELVIYTHPTDDGTEQLWARPIEMFLENVETESYKGPRFQYLESSQV